MDPPAETCGPINGERKPRKKLRRDGLIVALFILAAAQFFWVKDSRHLRSMDTTQSQQQQQLAARVSSSTSIIPLPDLVATNPENDCAVPLILIEDTILNSSIAYSADQPIPKIVHVTSRSRCVHPRFAKFLNQWRFQDHSFFFHNEEAVDRLLQKNWPEFPFLQQALHCIKSGAGKADLWRALVVYEYGGIYTDIDNAPSKFNGTTLSAKDQAFFVVERGGFLSQYFFAAAPKHPLMFQLVHQTMLRVYELHDVQSQYVPVVTGPGALKNAFIHFMGDQGPNPPAQGHQSTMGYPSAGLYTGFKNATVTVVGDKANSGEYVARGVVRRKGQLYEAMNMTHFTSLSRAQGAEDSCIQRIYNRMEFEQYWPSSRNNPSNLLW